MLSLVYAGTSVIKHHCVGGVCEHKHDQAGGLPGETPQASEDPGYTDIVLLLLLSRLSCVWRDGTRKAISS